MKKSLMIASWLVLAGMLVASGLCASRILSAQAHGWSLLAGTALWFSLAPFWMKRES